MDVKKLLGEVKNGAVSVETAADMLRSLPYDDLGFAKVDHHRQLRSGYPEVIFCQGKQIEHIEAIIDNMLSRGAINIMATRASEQVFAMIRAKYPDAECHELARIAVVQPREVTPRPGTIVVASAGTADLPVAEEASVTARVMGNEVVNLYDVGVAGIHRLLSRLDVLRGANVIIAAAGMEGALPGVIAGLVDIPVIAVPTSVGYGANFAGLSALLTMINSCVAGLAVVNIDNGFGAGYLASNINKIGSRT